MGKAKKYVVTEDGLIRCYSIPIAKTDEHSSLKNILIRILKRLKKAH